MGIYISDSYRSVVKERERVKEKERETEKVKKKERETVRIYVRPTQ